MLLTASLRHFGNTLDINNQSPAPRAEHKAIVSMSSPSWSPRHTDIDTATAAHHSKAVFRGVRL